MTNRYKITKCMLSQWSKAKFHFFVGERKRPPDFCAVGGCRVEGARRNAGPEPPDAGPLLLRQCNFPGNVIDKPPPPHQQIVLSNNGALFPCLLPEITQFGAEYVVWWSSRLRTALCDAFLVLKPQWRGPTKRPKLIEGPVGHEPPNS